MLYDLIGITSTGTILMWIFGGLVLALAVAGLAAVALGGIGVLLARIGARLLIARWGRKKDAPPASFRFDVFLSYASADAGPAAELAARIERAGLRVFFAGRSLEAGVPFTEEIRKALQDSRETWVLATTASVASHWVSTEWATAWATNRRIVPVRLGILIDALPERLRALHTVAYDDVAGELARAKKRLRR